MPEAKNNWFLILTSLSCLIAILCAFYFFYYKKDNDFIVEVPCDTNKNICLQRDCSNPDDCPANELSDFKRYSLKARDFQFCENENCANACETGKIKCELLECVEDVEYGESCSLSILETEESIQPND